ncbi:MAG: tRNA(Ile)-lysidine synthase, partial [Bacteroidota bacterium]
GIDSMVLLHLCSQSKLDFAVAHCNFQLRGDESNEDEAFVKLYAANLQVPIFIERFDTQTFAEQQKLSIQVVARNLRYEWFYSLLANHNFDYILTAHHLDDSLETFFINFTRGSGIEGLTGIPEQNDKIVRPLLIFSRKEIEAYAVENQISWREDSSNASDKYLRNKLRHDVIPVLKELNPSLLASFENTVLHLKQTQSLADDAVNHLYQTVVNEEEHHTVIDLKKLLQHTNYKAYLYQWLQPYGFSDWTAVYDLLEAQSGKQVLSDSHILLKNRGVLLLFPKQTKISEELYWIAKDQTDVKVPLKMNFCNVSDISNQMSNVIFVDEALLQFPLTLRRWQEGDVFQPSGMTGKKKLSKFFKDEKYSLWDKANAWLLCSDNKIVWIVGKRADERFKATANTTKILKINFEA